MASSDCASYRVQSGWRRLADQEEWGRVLVIECPPMWTTTRFPLQVPSNPELIIHPSKTASRRSLCFL
jgi:hypothetical protein